MKIKVNEKMISEIIGQDLEPIEGAMSDYKSGQTYANLDNNRGQAPPTTTKINRQASKEKDFFQRYMYGGNGSIRFSTYTSEALNVKEDVVTNSKRDADLISKETPSIEDLSNLFDEQILEQNIKSIVESLNKMSERKSEEQMNGIKYISLFYFLDNIDTSGLSSSEKQKLKNAIR
jgi:hypothetical protein